MTEGWIPDQVENDKRGGNDGKISHCVRGEISQSLRSFEMTESAFFTLTFETPLVLFGKI